MKRQCPACGLALRLPDDAYPVSCGCGRLLDLAAGAIVAVERASIGVTFPKLTANRPPPHPDGAPGTEFKRLAAELKLDVKGGCSCEALLRQMDQLGPDGCERQARKLLVALRENAKRYSWAERWQAAKSALAAGLYRSISPFDPLAGMLRLAISRSRRPGKYTLADVTVVVTSFLRFDCLRRFLTSLRFYYPGLAVLVVDQSGEHAKGEDYDACRAFPGLQWLAMPFDSGLSACRNAGVRAVKTRLVFVCDDDEVFEADSRVESLLAVLNHDREIDLVCGVLRDALGAAGGWFADLRQLGTTLNALQPLRPWRAVDDVYYRPADRFINVFLCRRELLVDVPWREEIKIGAEHLVHVMDLKAAGKTCAYTPQFVIGEIKSADPVYRDYRWRNKESANNELLGITDKKGSWKAIQVHGVRPAQSVVPVDLGKNLVVVTPGHTGSTIFAGLLGLLGWHLPDNDPEYNEPFSVRAANDSLLRGQPVDLAAVLAAFPEPWAIKDPRFADTLEQWLPALAAYRPALVWITRDSDAVAKSWQRRDAPLGRLAQRQERLARAYDAWPWERRQVAYEDLAAWAAAFRQPQTTVVTDNRNV